MMKLEFNVKYQKDRYKSLNKPGLVNKDLSLIDDTKRILDNNIEQLERLRNTKKEGRSYDIINKMKRDLGDGVDTGDVSEYVEKEGLDYAHIKDLRDPDLGDVMMFNHKPGNYLKSSYGNNGMFDMNNPNIYKSLVPAVGIGAAGAAATNVPEQEYASGGYTDLSSLSSNRRDLQKYVIKNKLTQGLINGKVYNFNKKGSIIKQ